MRPIVVALAVLLALGLSACSSQAPLAPKPEPSREAKPKLGACRALTAADLDRPDNATAAVACTEPHTAETFAIGTLPETTGTSYDDPRHGSWIYRTCQPAFADFIGADESTALRVQLSWAWFRPSEPAWNDGARWYRCDLVGGRAEDDPSATGSAGGALSLRELPTTAKGLVLGLDPPARWMRCARGATVAQSVKVACSEQHNWRAVTTIKVGAPQDPYPGDRVVEVRSRDYCSDSVGAWLNYPVDYEYGFTWFHEADWKTGNRRSICWAKTDR